MQTQKLTLGNLAKPLMLVFGDMLLRPYADMNGGLLLVHAPANDRADHFAQCCAVPHPKRIGVTQRLPDGSVTGGGSLVSPDEYVAQQFDASQLVHPEDGFGIGP